MRKNDKRDLVVIVAILAFIYWAIERSSELTKMQNQERAETELIEIEKNKMLIEEVVKNRVISEARESKWIQEIIEYEAKKRELNKFNSSDTNSIFDKPIEFSSHIDINQKKYFKQYPCLVDCAGHEAGYEWAKEKLIVTTLDCSIAGQTSNSPSFAEGCKAYVEELK